MSFTTARQERREELLEWATRSQDGIRISHSVFRHFKQCFPEVQYFEGVPFVPWKALKAKLSSPRGLIDVIATYFKGERLIVDGLGSRTLSTSAIRRDDISRNEKTFLRLEHVLKEERMFKALKSLMNDWYRETLYPGLVGNPSREYAVHHGPFVTGVYYKTPRPGTSGIYVLHCGATFSFNSRAYDGPFFILKKGQSIDIAGRVLHHKAASSMYGSKGTVKFLFGLELKSGDLNDAETLLKAKLTDLGFSRFTVSDNQGRTTETFVFNGKSLPLVHDVVCRIRFVYSLPTRRVSRDHANSIENPLYGQGLSLLPHHPAQQLRPPYPALSTLGLPFELRGPGWSVLEPPGHLPHLELQCQAQQPLMEPQAPATALLQSFVQPPDLPFELQGPGWSVHQTP